MQRVVGLLRQLYSLSELPGAAWRRASDPSGRTKLGSSFLHQLREHALRIYDNEKRAPTRQHLTFLIENLAHVHVSPAAHAHLPRLDTQRLVQRHRPQVLHRHLRSEGDHLPQLVHLTHSLIENGGDDAAVAVPWWPGVALIQTEVADKTLARSIVSKFQVHASSIVRTTSKAVVLRQTEITNIVTATLRLLGHKRKILYLTSLIPGASPTSRASIRRRNPV